MLFFVIFKISTWTVDWIVSLILAREQQVKICLYLSASWNYIKNILVKLFSFWFTFRLKINFRMKIFFEFIFRYFLLFFLICINTSKKQTILNFNLKNNFFFEIVNSLIFDYIFIEFLEKSMHVCIRIEN